MRVSDATLEKLLLKAQILSPEKLSDIKVEQENNHRPLQSLVTEKSLITDGALTKLYGEYINVPYTEIDPKSVDKTILTIIPERIARQYNAVVFDKIEDQVQLAVEDPDDIQAIDFIKKYIGSNFALFIATKETILQVLENYRDGVVNELSRVIEVQREDDHTGDAVSADEIAEDSPIAQTVNLLLEYAIRSSASDVHIEPRENSVQVRYRIDGVLRVANELPKSVMNALISRIKILSNLKIDEKRVPQDGRFKITIAGKSYALRVSTLPVSDGEKVVMRILDETNHALTLEELGYWGNALKAINNALIQPHGMVLVTGPTGSGKSTSLFSSLSLLNRPEVNISTVEDPIEYKIVGANQTQINPKAGMTFVAGLRALLRQDPNIIMVGEIRDGETANLAVQAALTGHLVFSTLHTNNAATCLPRLLDMQIEPFLIASTVRVVIGQRLVRKLCKTCRVSYEPNETELKNIMDLFNLTKPGAIEQIAKLDLASIEEKVGNLENDQPAIKDGKIIRLFKASPEGCEDCNHNGYKGRMGIYEVLDNTIAIQNLIMSNATSNQLQDQAILDGMSTMQTDGLIKSLRGSTSIEEILSATRE